MLGGTPIVRRARTAGDARSTLDPAVPVVLYADEWGGVGGTAGYVKMLAGGLVDRGFTVAVLCHAVPAMEDVCRDLERLGARVIPMPAGHGGPGARVTSFLTLVRRLRPYAGGVLALMMGYHTRGGGVALAGRAARIRAIARADLTPPEPPIGRMEAVLLRMKDRLVDTVAVGALENVHAFKVNMNREVRKMHVIHTGIGLDNFRPGAGREDLRLRAGLASDHILIGTLCRLDDQRKGVHDFLEMAAIVAARVPEARFVVVGEGVLKARLAEQASALRIADKVLFPGWASEAAAWYAAMEIFVMASTYEGGPTTLLEAMAMGLPVVATGVGMVPEVVNQDSTGFICSPGDPHGLAAAVLALAADEQMRTRIGQAARAKALAEFSVDRMVDGYLDLFGRAYAEKRETAG